MFRVLWQSLPANAAATSGKLLIRARTRTFAPLVEPKKSLPFIQLMVNAFPGMGTTQRISLRLSTKKVSRFSRGKESAVIRIA
jgi:hypothetical protein